MSTRRAVVVAIAWLAAVSGAVALVYEASAAIAPRSFGIWLRESRR